MTFARTVSRPVRFSGKGLHSGEPSNVVIHPSRMGGITFTRTDLPGRPTFRAHWGNVVATDHCTCLGVGGVTLVSTVEHLMAALAIARVSCARIEIDGPEVPVMDGSAAAIFERVTSARIVETDVPERVIEVTKPVRIGRKDGAVSELRPADAFSVTVGIDFPGTFVGSQSWSGSDEDLHALVSARTFGFAGEIAHLQARGLALGACLECAIGVDGETLMNSEGLRFPDEFARHKALDAVGDLMLAGCRIVGDFRSFKGGHAMTAALVKTLACDRDSWRYRNVPGLGAAADARA